jgi:hypothetical protein
MGYKFIGQDNTGYGTSEFYFESHGSPKSLRPGEWIDPEDLDYFRTNHPLLIQEFPGEGPEEPSEGDDSVSGTVLQFRVFTGGRPTVPPQGTYKMYVKPDGKIYVLGPDGRELLVEFEEFIQGW